MLLANLDKTKGRKTKKSKEFLFPEAPTLFPTLPPKENFIMKKRANSELDRLFDDQGWLRCFFGPQGNSDG